MGTFFNVYVSFYENFIAFGLVDLELWSIQVGVFRPMDSFETIWFESIGRIQASAREGDDVVRMLRVNPPFSPSFLGQIRGFSRVYLVDSKRRI